MWDSTPMPLPLDAYIDSWHGVEAVRWIEQYDRTEPFFLFVGFPGPHDPWDAPQAAVDWYHGHEVSMPRSTRRPTIEGTGRYGSLLRAFLGLSDTKTMTDDSIRGMRRAYTATSSIIDDAIGHMLSALEERDLLDDTWVIYTSDHGEMGGNHGLMSKCVLYQPAVRVPLIVRPPGGCPPQVIDSLVEHIDMPATVRARRRRPRDPTGRRPVAPRPPGQRGLEPQIGVGQRKLGFRVLRDRAVQDRRRRGRRLALSAFRPVR